MVADLETGSMWENRKVQLQPQHEGETTMERYVWKMSRTAVPGAVKNMTGSELGNFFEPYRQPYREAYRLTKTEG